MISYTLMYNNALYVTFNEAFSDPELQKAATEEFQNATSIKTIMFNDALNKAWTEVLGSAPSNAPKIDYPQVEIVDSYMHITGQVRFADFELTKDHISRDGEILWSATPTEVVGEVSSDEAVQEMVDTFTTSSNSEESNEMAEQATNYIDSKPDEDVTPEPYEEQQQAPEIPNPASVEASSRDHEEATTTTEDPVWEAFEESTESDVSSIEENEHIFTVGMVAGKNGEACHVKEPAKKFNIGVTATPNPNAQRQNKAVGNTNWMSWDKFGNRFQKEIAAKETEMGQLVHDAAEDAAKKEEAPTTVGKITNSLKKSGASMPSYLRGAMKSVMATVEKEPEPEAETKSVEEVKEPKKQSHFDNLPEEEEPIKPALFAGEAEPVVEDNSEQEEMEISEASKKWEQAIPDEYILEDEKEPVADLPDPDEGETVDLSDYPEFFQYVPQPLMAVLHAFISGTLDESAVDRNFCLTGRWDTCRGWYAIDCLSNAERYFFDTSGDVLYHAPFNTIKQYAAAMDGK